MRQIILGVLVVAATATAQPTTQQVIQLQDKQHVEAVAAFPGPAPMIAHFSGASAVVKGSPYSAEATTDVVQVLADGNRIVNKTSNKSYRDAEGRTRVEITPGATGAWMPDTKQFSMTMIDDPVSGDHITLNNNNKQATRFSSKGAGGATAGVVGAAGRVNVTTMVMRGSSDAVMPALPPGPAHEAGSRVTATYVQSSVDLAGNAFFSSGANPDLKKESLGKQVIEGVECTGTKETVTIPAGSFGNERAIESVTERWYSPELQLDVMTKTTDPRFGETTYRLGNIVRAEQPKSLFEIPADYKVEEPAVNIRTLKSDAKDVK